jgi:Right handed beta helix region
MTRYFAALAALALAWPAVAAAQAQRTFVASFGDDTNPCTFAQPCRAFAAAIAQTSDGGEVVILDSAGYGPVTITQSASIIAAPGVYAGITVFTGDGVAVSGVGTRVRLSGLTINGQGGDVGIHFQQGARLAIDHCVVSALNLYGIYVQAVNSTWIVSDTTIASNASYGLIAEAGKGTLDRVRVENNFSVGVLVNTTSSTLVHTLVRDSVMLGNAGDGLAVFSGSGRTALVTVESSTASLNGNAGFAGTTTGGTTLLTLRSSVADTNGASGVFASGVGATVSVTGSAAVRNTNFGLEQDTSAILRSLQNNTVEDNVAGPTSGTITNSTQL